VCQLHARCGGARRALPAPPPPPPTPAPMEDLNASRDSSFNSLACRRDASRRSWERSRPRLLSDDPPTSSGWGRLTPTHRIHAIAAARANETRRSQPPRGKLPSRLGGTFLSRQQCATRERPGRPGSATGSLDAHSPAIASNPPGSPVMFTGDRPRRATTTPGLFRWRSGSQEAHANEVEPICPAPSHQPKD